MGRRRGKYGGLWYALIPALILGGGILYMTKMPGKSYSGALPPLTTEQIRLADHLRKHITVLSEEIGERSI